MDNDTPLHLQEIIFSSSDPDISRTIGKLERTGKLKNPAEPLGTGRRWAGQEPWLPALKFLIKKTSD